MDFEKRLEEIATRKAEIRENITDDIDSKDIETFETEISDLEQEERELKQEKEDHEAELRAKDEKRKQAKTIKGEKAEKPEEVRDMKDFTMMESEELRSTEEYRKGFLKNLMGKKLDETEERALTTGAASAGAAVPTATLDRIIDKLRQTSALFNRISVSYIPGNVNLVVADAKNSANWKTEGSDGTPEDDTVKSVQLNGYELIKLVEISAAASAMTIDAFEQYIADEIGRQMAIAVENAILTGDGDGEPTGILEGITWTATENLVEHNGEITYDDLMDQLALLPTMYHPQSAFVMNRKTLFQQVRKIQTDDGMPIFAYNPQDQAAMSILGYEVILDDYMPDGEVLLGEFTKYFMNFSQAPSIETSREAGFKSGKMVYRGLAVADGKPALDEAFVLLQEQSV